MSVEELFNDFREFANKKNTLSMAIVNGGYEAVDVVAYLRRLNSDLNYVFNKFLRLPDKSDQEQYEFQLKEIEKFMKRMHDLHDAQLDELISRYPYGVTNEEPARGIK